MLNNVNLFAEKNLFYTDYKPDNFVFIYNKSF